MPTPTKKRECVVLLSADRPTITGRVYPLKVLREAIEKLGDKPVFGTVGFCPEPRSVEKISHVAKNLRIEGKELVADIEVLATPEGEKLGKMLDKLQFAPRGVGKASEPGKDGIVEISEYEIFSIDVVNPPRRPKSEPKL